MCSFCDSLVCPGHPQCRSVMVRILTRSLVSRDSRRPGAGGELDPASETPRPLHPQPHPDGGLVTTQEPGGQDSRRWWGWAGGGVLSQRLWLRRGAASPLWASEHLAARLWASVSSSGEWCRPHGVVVK